MRSRRQARARTLGRFAVVSELDRETLASEAQHLAATEAQRWRVSVEAGALRVYVTLYPAGSTDRYCLRLDFGDALAAGPPSVVFCEPETHAEGRRQDWPCGPTNYFKPPPDHGVGWICNPWTREGRAHHAEWRSHKWLATRTIWRVATAIQDILDKAGAYTGRLA